MMEMLLLLGVRPIRNGVPVAHSPERNILKYSWLQLAAFAEKFANVLCTYYALCTILFLFV